MLQLVHTGDCALSEPPLERASKGEIDRYLTDGAQRTQTQDTLCLWWRKGIAHEVAVFKKAAGESEHAQNVPLKLHDAYTIFFAQGGFEP